MSDIHDLVGAYAVDSLETSERDLFERHLRGCAGCQRELAESLEMLARVTAVHSTAPPPELRSSVLDAIAAAPAIPAQDVATVTDLASRRRRPWLVGLASAAAVLVIALSAVSLYQYNHIASITAVEQQRTQLLTAPDVQVYQAEVEGGRITYLVSREVDRAMVTATDFPDPGTERSWQVWVVKDGIPESGAVLDDGGTVQVFVDGVTDGQVLAMTNEPAGGSMQPTGEVQAAVEI